MNPNQIGTLMVLFFCVLFTVVVLYQKLYWWASWEDSLCEGLKKCAFIALWFVIAYLILTCIQEILTWDSIPFPMQ